MIQPFSQPTSPGKIVGYISARPFIVTYVESRRAQPITAHRHLSPKLHQLVFLSVASASTHLHHPSIITHTRAALALGATKREILEVLELTSTLGIHAANIGVPLLYEVLRETNHPRAPDPNVPIDEKPLDPKRQELKDNFTKNRGYWHSFWAEILDLDPDYFAGYIEYSSHPWVYPPADSSGTRSVGGVLSPKEKELIYCAFDCAATHLYVAGLKLHMVNALRYGASPEEIMEVIECASLLSFRTMTVGVPVLVEELKRAGRDA